MQKLEIGGIYKHYKGTKVKVLGEAFDSESLELVVIYIHLEDGVIWVRPKKMFLETITVNGHAKGRASKKVKRFQKIKQIILIKPRRK